MNSCDHCLFFTEPFPGYYECIAGKRIIRLADIRFDCKKWVECTRENAEEWLARNGYPQADASDFASETESESSCMTVEFKS